MSVLFAFSLAFITVIVTKQYEDVDDDRSDRWWISSSYEAGNVWHAKFGSGSWMSQAYVHDCANSARSSKTRLSARWWVATLRARRVRGSRPRCTRPPRRSTCGRGGDPRSCTRGSPWRSWPRSRRCRSASPGSALEKEDATGFIFCFRKKGTKNFRRRTYLLLLLFNFHVSDLSYDLLIEHLSFLHERLHGLSIILNFTMGYNFF